MTTYVLLFALLFTQSPQTMTYFIEDGAGVKGYRTGDRELAGRAFEAWARESAGKLKLVPSLKETEALLRIRWVAADRGRFGEMQRIPVQGKPGAIVFVSPGVGALGETFAARTERDQLFRDTIVYLTCVHEIGHALGLSHTSNFEDIMYSFQYGGDLAAYFLRYRNKLTSRADISRFSGLSANDIAILKALY